MQRWPLKSISVAVLAVAGATPALAADTFWQSTVARAQNGGPSAQSASREKSESAPLDSRQVSAGDADLHEARAHLEAGAIDAAVASYRALLLRVQAQANQGEASQIAALTGLGKALLRNGEANEGIAALERAVQISRRSGGLFDVAQIDSLETLASFHAEAGRLDEADALYRYLVQIHAQQYGADDVETAAAVTAMATFRRGAGHYLAARNLYRRAIAIIEHDRGSSAPELIAPLAGLADVYRREALGIVDFEIAPGFISPADEAAVNTRSDLLSAGARKHAYSRRLHPAGLSYLNRALKVAQRQANDVDPSLYHALLVQAGDWLLLRGKPADAMRFYEGALSLESENEIPSSALDQVAPVYLALPSAATRHKWLPMEAVNETFAVIEFDVNERGAVENVRIAEGNAGDADHGAAIRAFRHSIYRPRFVAGEPVETKDVSYRLVFRKRI